MGLKLYVAQEIEYEDIYFQFHHYEIPSNHLNKIGKQIKENKLDTTNSQIRATEEPQARRMLFLHLQTINML